MEDLTLDTRMESGQSNSSQHTPTYKNNRPGISMAQQKRMLTGPNSKVGKVDLVAILRDEESWALLPRESREQLYTLLPAPKDGESAHDPDVHPLNTRYKPFLEEELRRYQEDLKAGWETKAWRDEAMQAGKDGSEGKFDEWRRAQREEYWGATGDDSSGKEKEGA